MRHTILFIIDGLPGAAPSAWSSRWPARWPPAAIRSRSPRCRPASTTRYPPASTTCWWKTATAGRSAARPKSAAGPASSTARCAGTSQDAASTWPFQPAQNRQDRGGLPYLEQAWLCLHCAIQAGQLAERSGIRRWLKNASSSAPTRPQTDHGLPGAAAGRAGLRHTTGADGGHLQSVRPGLDTPARGPALPMDGRISSSMSGASTTRNDTTGCWKHSS